MPIFALAAFWIWPLSVAGPVYSAIAVLSLWMYVLIIRAMRQPVLSGAEKLLHSFGKVTESEGRALRVRVHSEIWNAESSDVLRSGDRVKVTGISGLILRVSRCDDGKDGE